MRGGAGRNAWALGVCAHRLAVFWESQESQWGVLLIPALRGGGHCLNKPDRVSEIRGFPGQLGRPELLASRLSQASGPPSRLNCAGTPYDSCATVLAQPGPVLGTRVFHRAASPRGPGPSTSVSFIETPCPAQRPSAPRPVAPTTQRPRVMRDSSRAGSLHGRATVPCVRLGGCGRRGTCARVQDSRDFGALEAR